MTSTSPPKSPTRSSDQPLELTVHSLPTASEAAPIQDPQAEAHRQKVGRIKMFLVLLLCASPVIASYFAYYVVRPEGRRNYGELVEQRSMPPSLLGRSAFKQTETAEPLTTLRDQWLLISVAGGACDAACEKHLYLQRQMRESLGKEKDRLDWVWLVNDTAPIREELRGGLQQAVVQRVDAAALSAWLAPAPGKRLEDHLYVVDPIGNWMMRFPAELDAPRAKRDLDRLLRASRHWDNAGRDAAAAAKLPTASTPRP